MAASKSTGEFSRSKFLQVEETTSNNLTLGLLTNNVHAIFDQPLRSAVGLDYSVIEQSAKLATRYLESGVLDRLILTLFNDGKPGRLVRYPSPEGKEKTREKNEEKGKKKAPKKGRKKGEKKTEEKEGKDDNGQDDENTAREISYPDGSSLGELVPLTSADRLKVKEILQRVAVTVSFELNSVIVPNDAATEWTEDYADPAFPNGRKSKIKLSQQHYDRLVDAQQHKGKDTPLLLQLQVDLASTLVHEVGHVIDNLAHGRLKQNTYIGDSIISEPGFEVETRLHGGLMTMLTDSDPALRARKYYAHDGVESGLVGVLVLWEYPYQGVASSYRNEGGMELRGPPRSVRPYDVAWRVPISFLRDLFKDSFWQGGVSDIEKALRPECSVGHCFRFDEDKGILPVNKGENDEAKLYVPGGYRRLPSGDICREVPGIPMDTYRFWRFRAHKFASRLIQRPWKYLSEPKKRSASDSPEGEPASKKQMPDR